MDKRRWRLVDGAVYVWVRLVVALLQATPWTIALWWSRRWASWGYRLGARHRKIALENVRHAFPELDEAARVALVRRSYEHLAALVVEVVKLPRTMTFENHKRYITCPDVDILRHWWGSGRPVIALTGHYGNWEVLGYLTGLLGFHTRTIARRLDNPYLDRYLNRFRSRTGMEVLDKNTDYDRIVATLEEGRVLGMVGDQYAGHKGLYVDFFGRPASTYKSIALLSLQYDAPIVVLGAARLGHPLRYNVYIEEVIQPAEFAARPDAPRLLTERFTAVLERLVRRHPEQYFWVHRRWKDRRKARAKRAA